MKCFTQFGDTFLGLNFDEFRDIAPLIVAVSSFSFSGEFNAYLSISAETLS